MSAISPIYDRNHGRSAEAAPAPAPAPSQGPARTRLRVIEGSKGQLRQAALPVLIGAIFLFLATIILPLILNTAMASLAYDIRDERIELAEVQAEIETLESKILTVSSTANLRKQAEEIGLVPVGPIGVISLENATVEGGGPAR